MVNKSHLTPKYTVIFVVLEVANHLVSNWGGRKGGKGNLSLSTKSREGGVETHSKWKPGLVRISTQLHTGCTRSSLTLEQGCHGSAEQKNKGVMV